MRAGGKVLEAKKLSGEGAGTYKFETFLTPLLAFSTFSITKLFVSNRGFKQLT